MSAKITDNLTFKIKNETVPFIILGHLTFILLFLLSVYFYKERVIFTDSVFQFFKIINFGEINIEAHRYGAVLPQLPVLLLEKLGLNLKILTISFSSAFILLYYFVFIICTHFLKNIEAGLAIVLVLILCISQSFFHPVTETHQSLVFSVLLYAILMHNKFRHELLRFFLSILVIAFSFLAHPIALYSIVFVIGYVAIEKKQLKSMGPYILLAVIGSMTLAKVLLTNENSYEGKFFSELMNSPEILFRLHKTQSLKFFATRAFTLYFWIFALETILIYYMLAKRQHLKLFWQLLVMSGFMLITIITYNKGDATLMMERAFMPMALFISIPFMHEIKSGTNNIRILKIVFVTIVVIFCLYRIFDQGLRFKTRTEFNQNLLKKTAQFPNRKFIIEKSEIDSHVLAFWSNSFESLILSAIDVNVPTQTIFLFNNPESLTKYTENNNNSIFLGTDFWLEWDIESLNPNYFSLSKDEPYRIITLDDL